MPRARKARLLASAPGRTPVVHPCEEMTMSLFESSPSTSLVPRAELPLSDEPHLGAAAFCARYSRRTLESYRTDFRHVPVGARRRTRTSRRCRAHIELYRATL